jgi:4-hydroxybenzoate polyprenyltransferase
MILNKAKLGAYCQLARLDKPIGILLLLWPTLWGLWLSAQGWPGWRYFFIFSVGVLLMRSCGCIANDILDSNLDQHVERTKSRPLASGRISIFEALCVMAVFSSLALCLVLLLNRYCLWMAIIGFALTCIYPLMKRFIHLPQAFLGITFAWGIPMAFMAVRTSIPPLAWLLYVANVLWVIGYDTQYAMVDRDDDITVGIKSSALLFGRYSSMMIVGLQSIFIGLMLLVGILQHLNIVFYLALLIAFLVLLWQWRRCAVAQSREQWFAAFLANHWVGLVLFIGIVLGPIHF